MSYSLEATRRRLPWLALAAAIVTILFVWQFSLGRLLGNLDQLPFFVAWLAGGHLLCGFSFWLTSRSCRRSLIFLKGSLGVYYRFGSLMHGLAALLTAILEELLFRYGLLFGVLHLCGRGWLAVGGSALVFALCHVQKGRLRQRLWHQLDMLVLGLVLGSLTLYLSSLYPAILIHGTRNYILRCMLVSKAELAALNR